jgi:GNAT superfamily N-acetyltransferase
MTMIRAIDPGDRAQWAVLWQGYLAFYGVADMAPEITERSWARFFNAAEPVHAMVAQDGAQLLGLVHYIFHRNTWFLNDLCYLQDLFTAPAARGKGVARALIEAVYAQAALRGAKRVYWMTHESNATAQLLYDKLAVKSGFIQYRKNI